jgi:hypothetical protein
MHFHIANLAGAEWPFRLKAHSALVSGFDFWWLLGSALVFVVLDLDEELDKVGSGVTH